MSKIVCLSLLFVLVFDFGYTQKLNGFGWFYKVGVAQNSDAGTSSNNVLNDMAAISSSTGLYKIFNLKKDTLNRMINYIKADIHPFSFRSGIFSIENSAVKLNSIFIDLDLIIPVRFGLSSTLDVYCGVGPMISFLVNQEEIWVGNVEALDQRNIQIGLVGEIGFLSKGRSSIGIRSFSGYSNFPLTEISVFVGIGFQDVYNARKAK
jgi:hypothetical protein